MGRSPVSAHPLEHRVVAPQHLKVLGRPHVDSFRAGSEEIEVGGGVEHPLARDLPAQGLRPDRCPAGATGGQDLVHQDVRAPLAAPGHLDRERTSRCKRLEQAREQRLVSVHPLEGRVRVDEAGRGGWGPGADVRFEPLDSRPTVSVSIVRGARTLQHVGRVVDALHPRSRPALRDEARNLARPASEVHDDPRVLRGTLASSSTAGRRWWSENLWYWAGSQGPALVVIVDLPRFLVRPSRVSAVRPHNGRAMRCPGPRPLCPGACRQRRERERPGSALRGPQA